MATRSAAVENGELDVVISTSTGFNRRNIRILVLRQMSVYIDTQCAETRSGG